MKNALLNKKVKQRLGVEIRLQGEDWWMGC